MAVWEYRIYVADAETAEGRPIADGMRPIWSPDGRWIVYEVSRDDELGTVEMWRVRPDGSDAMLLGEGSMAAFSPDGTRLAMVRENGLWMMGPDGSNATLVIPATIIDGYAWSPNGDSVVVASNHAGGDAVGLSVVRIDLEAPAITGLVDQAHAPSWRPLIVEPVPAD
jgi:Tol biopolymer transport system component